MRTFGVLLISVEPTDAMDRVDWQAEPETVDRVRRERGEPAEDRSSDAGGRECVVDPGADPVDDGGRELKCVWAVTWLDMADMVLRESSEQSE